MSPLFSTPRLKAHLRLATRSLVLIELGVRVRGHLPRVPFEQPDTELENDKKRDAEV